MITWVELSTKTSMEPLVPAGTSAALASTRPLGGVQGGDRWLCGAAGPYGEIAERAGWDNGHVEGVCLGRLGQTAGARWNREGPGCAAAHDGSAERAGRIAGIGGAAGADEEEVQSAGSWRRKVTVDIDNEMGGVAREETDCATGTGRHDGRIGDHGAIKGVQGRDAGLWLSTRPGGDKSEEAWGHGSHIEGIGCGSGGNATGAGGNGEGSAATAQEGGTGERGRGSPGVHCTEGD